MKPAAKPDSNKPRAALAAMIIALALSGCGNKGGLVLPADPEATAPEETTQDAGTDQPEPKETP